ncbi:MAG TPA: DUF1778 domain-containing protein [Rhizobium sp.]
MAAVQAYWQVSLAVDVRNSVRGGEGSNSYVQTFALSCTRNGSQTRLSCCSEEELDGRNRVHRLEETKDITTIWLSEADAAVVKRAADQCGQSLTEFAHTSILRFADDVIIGRLIVMTPEGFSDFCLALSEPAASVPEMVELINRPVPWERGQTADK